MSVKRETCEDQEDNVVKRVATNVIPPAPPSIILCRPIADMQVCSHCARRFHALSWLGFALSPDAKPRLALSYYDWLTGCLRSNKYLLFYCSRSCYYKPAYAAWPLWHQFSAPPPPSTRILLAPPKNEYEVCGHCAERFVRTLHLTWAQFSRSCWINFCSDKCRYADHTESWQLWNPKPFWRV